MEEMTSILKLKERRRCRRVGVRKVEKVKCVECLCATCYVKNVTQMI